ncbi:MAG TPA: hypothetical protein VGR71_16800 [Nitrospira sp.]|nr:hypothetical protein [Nitrospira sp.]
MPKVTCQVTECSWTAEDPIQDLAGCLATWHIFEEHPDVWTEIFGSGRPLDPDPRTESGRAEILAANGVN